MGELGAFFQVRLSTTMYRLSIHFNDRVEHEKRDKIPLLIHQLFVFDQYPFFEEHYVYVARKFYLEESERLAEEMKDDAPGFFKWMKSRLDEELKRAQEILPVSSWVMVRKATEEAVWMDRAEWLANESERLVTI